MRNVVVVAVAGVLLLAMASPGRAQTTTISANTSTSQTVGAGTSTLVVDAGVSVNVSNGKNAVAAQGAAEIDNSGTIEQTGTTSSTLGRGIRDTKNAGYTVTIKNFVGATISALADDAIEIGNSDPSNGAVLYNQGTIQAQGSSDQAVNLNHVTAATSTVYNYASGLIASQEADAVRPGAGGSSFTSSIYNAGIVCIASSAGDTSSSDGVDMQSNSGGNVYNGPFTAYSGTPSDTTTAATTVPASCPATVSATAIIQGERHGITGGNTNDGQGGTTSTNGTFVLSVANATGYTIQGDNGSGINIDGFGVNATGANGIYTGLAASDIYTNEVVTITNNGTITGNGVTRDGDGVDVDGLVMLTNNGTIKSLHAYNDTSEGVTVGGGTIINNPGALIEGDNSATNADSTANSGTGRGITLAGIDHEANTDDDIPIEGIYANTTVTNSGTIRGQTDAGIALTGAGNPNSVTITNQAGGLIEGAGSGYAAVYTGGNVANVTNAGTITEDSVGVNAIDLGSANSQLTISGGVAAVNGNISGGSGSSTLSIAPGAGNTFSYAGAISNFVSAEFSAGSTVLSGSNAYTGASTIDNAATLQIDGSFASASSVNGTLMGKGTLSADVSIGNGGVIHPGDVAGDVATLTTGALTLDAGATANFDLSGSSTLASSSIQVNGQLSIGSGVQLVISAPSAPGNYTLFNATSISGTFATPTFTPALPSDETASVAVNGTTVVLTLQSTSSVAVSSSGSPSIYGKSVTFTASVSGSQPGGSVTFFDGSVELGNVALSGGVAQWTTSNLDVGAHQITAQYGGDANNTGSTSAPFSQQVNQATSNIGLSVSPNPATTSQTVTFVATVTGGDPPTGAVTFYANGVSLGSVALTNGVATFASNALGAGSHSITASYSGDDNFLASGASAPVTLVVRAATAATTGTAAAPMQSSWLLAALALLLVLLALPNRGWRR